MKKTLFLLICTISCMNSLMAADVDPKGILLKASEKLAAQTNYSWRTTVEVPGEPTGTMDGKTEKDGAIVLALARGDRSYEGVIKGAKVALKNEEGWKSFAEAAAMEGSQSSATRFVARLLQNFKTPSAELADLAGKLNELTLAIAIRTAASAEETYTGVLTEETAKNLILYRTPSGAGGPEVSEASGSMKIWLKAGALSKYEIQLHATLKFTDNEREVTRVHTTEIKEVGTTKVIVPAEAAKKL